VILLRIYLSIVDWLGTDKEVTAGPIDSEAIPASWGKHPETEGRAVISQHLRIFSADRQQFDCGFGCLQDLRLPFGFTSNERDRNSRRGA
jgi:hypothetical protein